MLLLYTRKMCAGFSHKASLSVLGRALLLHYKIKLVPEQGNLQFSLGTENSTGVEKIAEFEKNLSEKI